MTDSTPSLPEPGRRTDWATVLREQGRTMTWLAKRLGMNRTYLTDVAAGRKQGSVDLIDRILEELEPEASPSSSARRLRDQRAWAHARAQRLQVADVIRRCLIGELELEADEAGEMTDKLVHEIEAASRRALVRQLADPEIGRALASSLAGWVLGVTGDAVIDDELELEVVQ